MNALIRPELSHRRLGRTRWMVGVLVPLGLLSMAALAANRDYEAPGNMAAIVVLVVGELALVVLRAGWWRVAVGALLGWVLLTVPATVLQATELRHQGELTPAVVTGMHGYVCDIRRVDGQPLPHAALDSCYAPIGGTESVIVDPAGWVAPISAADSDDDGFAIGLGTVLGCTVLWGWIAVDAPRRSGARNAIRAR